VQEYERLAVASNLVVHLNAVNAYRLPRVRRRFHPSLLHEPSRRRARKSRPVKAALDVALRQTKDDGATVRACCGRGGEEEAVNEPAHLLFGERRVDFNGGAACERGGDFVAQGGARAPAFF